MSFIHALRHQLHVFLRQSQYERELDDEMRFHLSLEQMQAAREGRSASDARYVARQRFGNVTFLKEETRRMAGLSVFDAVRQDLRYAARAFLRAPGFTVAATLTLALGIGATTAVFSVVDGVLLRGLVYRDAEQLAMVLERRDDGGQRLPSYPTFRDWRAGRAAWSDAIEDMAFIRGTDLLLAGERGPERLTVAAVTPGFFHLMGTPALLGRTFLPDEEVAGANAVVVLTYDLWQHRFGGDRSVVGKTVPFKGGPALVIGVMPRGFAYPDWASLFMPIARIEPTDSALARRGVHADS